MLSPVISIPTQPAINSELFLFNTTPTGKSGRKYLASNLKIDGRHQVASLDHALWLHRPCRADDWLLYVQDSPSACGARALICGMLFSRDGVLVASVAQEGLIRPIRKTPIG